MSTNAHGRPQIDKGKRTFQIVASQFNPQYVQGVVDDAATELRELAPGAAISICICIGRPLIASIISHS